MIVLSLTLASQVLPKILFFVIVSVRAIVPKSPSNFRERIIKEELIVKEPAKNQVYYGLNAGFNKADYVSAVGAGVILKTKKDKIYQLGIGVNNRTTDGTNGAFSPYVGFGTYWKIKVKK